MYFVYMMTNWNNYVLYVGVTGDLERRLYEHLSKQVPGFTCKYNLNKLVYYEEYRNADQAIYREKQLKRWGRVKKNGLVNAYNPYWQDMSQLFLKS